MFYKLMNTIIVCVFLCLSLSAGGNEKLEDSHLFEDDFVIVGERTPLLSETSKIIRNQSSHNEQKNNRLHDYLLSNLDEHGVDDRTDSIIECLHCCCFLFKNCFGDQK